MTKRLILFAPFALLAACTAGGGGAQDADVPGDAADVQPYAGIGDGDVIRILGTEPFWGGDIRGNTLTWSTPEDIDGQAIAITRFAGRGGMSFTGTLDEQDFTLLLTEATCSDGMSDRTYPFVVTVTIGAAQPQEQKLGGCGWTDAKPFTGGE